MQAMLADRMDERFYIKPQDIKFQRTPNIKTIKVSKFSQREAGDYKKWLWLAKKGGSIWKVEFPTIFYIRFSAHQMEIFINT